MKKKTLFDNLNTIWQLTEVRIRTRDKDTIVYTVADDDEYEFVRCGDQTLLLLDRTQFDLSHCVLRTIEDRIVYLSKDGIRYDLTYEIKK